MAIPLFCFLINAFEKLKHAYSSFNWIKKLVIVTIWMVTLVVVLVVVVVILLVIEWQWLSLLRLWWM